MTDELNNNEEGVHWGKIIAGAAVVTALAAVALGKWSPQIAEKIGDNALGNAVKGAGDGIRGLAGKLKFSGVAEAAESAAPTNIPPVIGGGKGR